MKRLLFLGVAFMAVGVFLVFSASSPGVIVSASETTHLMGNACYQNSTTPMYICYGGNCMSGGCGCMQVYTLITGTHKRQENYNAVCRDGRSCVQTYFSDIGGSCGE